MCSLGLLAGLGGCSGSEPDPSSAGGNSGGPSGGSSSGTGGSGGSATSGGGTGGGSAIPDVVVGTFQVEMTIPDDAPDSWRTSVVGKVSDGISPQSIVWDPGIPDGDCWLEKPRAPFCSEGCGTEVCVEDDVCLGYPTGHSVGEVTLSGVALVGGGTELLLKEVSKTYQPSAGVMLADPPFGESDEVKLSATGGDYTAFDMTALGISPLEVTSTDFELANGKALELTWEPAAHPLFSVVHVKIDISHHGGSRGLIQCDAVDDGALTVSAALVSELIGLGFAGFPTLVMTRTSRDSAQLAPGRVELVLAAKVEQPVTIEGLISCSGGDPEPGAPPECPTGTTCQDDLKCE
ncbi:MAG TPA: hypothetical protein VIW29_18810 [Polyangiaceae bacterium]